MLCHCFSGWIVHWRVWAPQPDRINLVLIHHAGRTFGRQIHVVAESDLNDVRLLVGPELGDYGLDAQWSDDFHHMVHVALTGE